MRPARAALDRALLAMAQDRRRPRCATTTNGKSLWLSDSETDRALAAQRCTGCPVLAACDAAATEAREPFGVWGGKDRTRHPHGPPRRTRKRTRASRKNTTNRKKTTMSSEKPDQTPPRPTAPGATPNEPEGPSRTPETDALEVQATAAALHRAADRAVATALDDPPSWQWVHGGPDADAVLRVLAARAHVAERDLRELRTTARGVTAADPGLDVPLLALAVLDTTRAAVGTTAELQPTDDYRRMLPTAPVDLAAVLWQVGLMFGRLLNTAAPTPADADRLLANWREALWQQRSTPTTTTTTEEPTDD